MKNLKSFSLTSVLYLLHTQSYFVFTIKSLILLLLLSLFQSWSNPNFNKKLDKEFRSNIPSFTSEIIGKGLFLPGFNNEIPFWHQIGNSEQLPDIEDFYARFNPMIMDQIKEGIFYLKLQSIRDIEFLKAHFTEKFSGNNRDLTSDNNSDFVQLFVEHINEKDLDSIKDFMEKHRFSKTEQILTIILLIHKNRFKDQIFDFIKDLSLDINQTVINRGFIYKHFYFLKSGIVITSLAHELIATGDPRLIQKVINDKFFNSNIKTPLGENLIHFFIRSNKVNPSSTPVIAIHLLLNKFSYFINEKDFMGFTPLTTAVQLSDRISVDEILSFISSHSAHFDLRDMLKDRDYYGRSIIDIAFYNENVELALYLKEIADLFSIDTTSSLYVIRSGSHQLIPTNKLPYIHISPFFLSYAENIQRILEQNTNYETEDPTEKKEIEEINISLNNIKRESAEIDIWEQQRQTLISQLLTEKSFLAIVSAIQKKSNQALTELGELEKQLLGVLISLEKGQPVFHEMEFLKQNHMLIPQNRSGVTIQYNITILTHFLNEAIIYSSLPVVQYLLKNEFDKEWFKLFIESDQTIVNFIIDPLSLALIVYASIPEENEQSKKDAKKIIRLLSEYQNPEIYSNARIYSSPMGWAISLGLLDEIKFFHEEKFADIPEDFVIGVNGVKMGFKTLFPTEIHNFLFLREYILENQEQENTISHCEQVFMQ